MEASLPTPAPAPLAPYRADENPAVVYLAGLAPGSRRTMRQGLGVMAGLLGFDDPFACPWPLIRYEHAAAIRSFLMQRYAPATANKMLSALRGVLKAAHRLGQISGEDYARARDLDPVSGERPEAASGRALSMAEIGALIGACPATRKGRRDAALIAVAYGCGLRRAEIAGLNREDFKADVLTIRGKRNKTRTVPLAPGALAALEDWLSVRGDHPGPLFVRMRKGDRMTDFHLTTQAVYHIQGRRGLEAAVAPFTPHDLRRTFAGDLLDAGVDIVTVQKLMGHAGVNTTARYDRRGERAKQAAVRTLHVPYRRR